MRRRDLLGGTLAAAALTPFGSRAQQKALPVVGYLNPTSPAAAASFATAFRQGLSDAGYFEGQNLAIEYRWAEGHYDRLPALAADLVGRKVNLIATLGRVSTLAAKSATSTIPIVFMGIGDPVEMGLSAFGCHFGVRSRPRRAALRRWRRCNHPRDRKPCRTAS